MLAPSLHACKSVRMAWCEHHYTVHVYEGLACIFFTCAVVWILHLILGSYHCFFILFFNLIWFWSAWHVTCLQSDCWEITVHNKWAFLLEAWHLLQQSHSLIILLFCYTAQEVGSIRYIIIRSTEKSQWSKACKYLSWFIWLAINTTFCFIQFRKLWLFHKFNPV